MRLLRKYYAKFLALFEPETLEEKCAAWEKDQAVQAVGAHLRAIEAHYKARAEFAKYEYLRQPFRPDTGEPNLPVIPDDSDTPF